MGDTGKRCSRCRNILPSTEFGSDRRASDGLRSSCRSCRKAEVTPDAKAAYDAAHYAANRDRRLVQVADWAAANPESVSAYKQRWKSEHPEALSLGRRIRRDRVRANGVVEPVTLDGVRQRHGDGCHWCEVPVDWDRTRSEKGLWPSVEHLVPIALGGCHTWDNCRISHRFCNGSRGARLGPPPRTVSHGG